MRIYRLFLGRGDRITIERDQYMPVTYVVVDADRNAVDPGAVVLALRVDDEGGPLDTGRWETVG